MNDLKEILKNMRQHLMTGVSYMIPFVVAGGILLALSVVLSGQPTVPDKESQRMLYDLFFIGVRGFELMIPILAGYIAYSIAERPALAPAAIAAMVGNLMGAGFFGALASGIIAGIVVFYLKKIKVPKIFRSVMPIFVIPIIGTFITAGLMQWVIGQPIAAFSEGLQAWLQGMSEGSLIVLAIIMGLMNAFDLGGPVNKVSYAFTILSVGAGAEAALAGDMAKAFDMYHIAAINSVCVCVPPIGMGLATLLAPKKYTVAEREAGKASILMGCVGITEGAIPFAAADPLKVIPSLMAGTAIGAAVASLFEIANPVAWGGLVVLPALQKGHFFFVVAIVVGAVASALIVNLLKKPVPIEEDNESDDGEEIDLSFE